jgi:hypothetical protein
VGSSPSRSTTSYNLVIPHMNEKQINLATASVIKLALVTGNQVETILELLRDNIISSEDCGRIEEKIREIAS